MSRLEVDKIDPQSGTALEIGTSGDTITVPSGVGLTLTNSTLLLPTTIKTDKLDPKSGTALEIGTSGDTITVPTGAGLTVTDEVKTNKISPATGTAFTLGDSGDTFTIPSGATLTNNGTATGFAGITEADSWRLTTDFSGNASPIASNWERSDTAGQGNFGTGMSQASGIFTFPSTGWWFIIAQAGFKLANDTSKYDGIYIVGTTNNSTYANLAGSDADIGNPGGTSYTATCVSTLFDVTDTTQCKVRFDIAVQTSATETCGQSTYDLTGAKFIRLGDT